MSWGGSKTKKLSPLVVATYGSTCYLCGGPIDMNAPARSPLSLSIDHVRPRSLQGSDDIENLRPVHFRCNVRRGNRTPRRSGRMNTVAAGLPGLADS